MTTPPRAPDPALHPAAPPACCASHAGAMPAAVSYVLNGAASLIADDGDTADAGMLECGAMAACATYDLPSQAAAAVFRRAAFHLARASGYQPLDPGDPVIDRAVDELPSYPPERQIRLLAYAARRAGAPGWPGPAGPRHPAGPYLT